MESIKNWLNSGRNYNVGLALYKVYGNDANLLAALEQGESTYRKGRLLEELTKIYESRETPAPEQPPVRINTLHIPQPAQPVDHSKDPYYEKWHPLFKEMNQLRARLRMYTDNEERGKAAFRILELERQVKYWQQRRDYFFQTGQHMPADDEPEQITDPKALVKRLNTLRTYITRYNRKVKEQPHNADYQAKLEQYTAELNEIQKKLEQ